MLLGWVDASPPVVLYYNVFMGLNFGFPIRVVSRELREKFLVVFANWGIACGHVGETST